MATASLSHQGPDNVVLILTPREAVVLLELLTTTGDDDGEGTTSDKDVLNMTLALKDAGVPSLGQHPEFTRDKDGEYDTGKWDLFPENEVRADVEPRIDELLDTWENGTLKEIKR